MNTPSADSIETRARFDFVRYANCWEDADILCAALNPTPGKRILSIASAGDNAFALAADGAEIVACDLNPAQIACAELKAAAIRLLDYRSVLDFLGIQDAAGGSRTRIYETLRSELPSAYRSFWDTRKDILERGFIHDGKFEKYFNLFRTRMLPFVAGKKKVDALLALHTTEERYAFYNQEWNTWRWRMLFRVFFSRFVMGRFGRDPEFFRYVEGSVSERILSRARYGLTELPTDSNPYLRYILTGNFNPSMPRFLRNDLFERVRVGVKRVKFICAPIQEAAEDFKGDGFDGFNLSDIFEYLSEELCVNLYGGLLRMARPRARLAYWNMLVPRRCPAPYSSHISALTDLSQKLFKADLAFFYSAFIVEEVNECRSS